MSKGNIKTNSPVPQWLHRTVYIRSVHWTGISHFIHHLELAAVILQNQSTPLEHTNRNTQFSHRWEIQMFWAPMCTNIRVQANQPLPCIPRREWHVNANTDLTPTAKDIDPKINSPSLACAHRYTLFPKLLEINENKLVQEGFIITIITHQRGLLLLLSLFSWEPALISKTFYQSIEDKQVVYSPQFSVWYICRCT